MSQSMKRLAARVDSIIDRAAAGERIDWAKENRVSDLETVRAGVEFASEAIDRTNAADAEHSRKQNAADGVTDARNI